LKLGLVLGYAGARVSVDLELVHEAESLGFDSVWTPELYGTDGVATAAWILARTSRIRVGTGILQIPARTPACAAGAAISLDHLSGGRFLLGLGPSGPQVVEGWHGVPYGRPVTRTREYVAIIRKILAREAPVEFDGVEYRLPWTGPGASGLGKPLKSIPHGNPTLPIYTASISPAGLRCAAEVADGVIPVWMSPERFDLFEKPLSEGFAAAGGGKGLERFDVAPYVPVVVGGDLEQCRRPVQAMLALYIGGMGARGRNFYNDYARRLGYEAEALRIQDLFLAGRKAEAAAAVPAALVDEIALVGPRERIAERLAAWREAGARRRVGSILASGASREGLRLLAEELL
jgi:F420-dependent oxidoreductase-like protein